MHKCVNNTIGNVYHLEQWVDNFFPYSQEQLGFDKPVSIIFQSDEDNASKMLGKTAYYDPEQLQVVLYTDGRHPKDVMRSLSHELVHHAQNCRGDFTSADSTSAGYAQEDPHLRDMEREAYERGNLIFRDFEDLIKTGKINIEINFSDSGEPKMSLKEWKNNEINTKLMKKWGIFKEAKKPMKLKPDTAADLDNDGETNDEVPAFLDEVSKEKESEDYGKDESADKREEDRLEHHIDRIEHHLDNLRDDMGFDQHREDDHMDEMEETLTPGLGRRKKPSKAHQDEEGNRLPSATSFVDGGRTAAKTLARRNRRGREPGMKIGGVTAEGYDGASQKISIKEAKEITRRIIERIQEDSH